MMKRFVLTLALLLAAAPVLAADPAPATPPDPAVVMATVDALRAEQRLREVQVKELASKTETQIHAMRAACGTPCAELPHAQAEPAPPAAPK